VSSHIPTEVVPEVIPWERFQKEAERGLDVSVYITSMNAHILNQRDEINRLRGQLAGRTERLLLVYETLTGQHRSSWPAAVESGT
jgi:hypothetical protein